MTDRPSPNRRGRPTRAQVSAKVLAGLDVSKVDPWLILATIASDPSAPAAARVAACRVLIDNERSDGDDAAGGSHINARAVAMMMRRTN
jgi:hypothetical protein